MDKFHRPAPGSAAETKYVGLFPDDQARVNAHLQHYELTIRDLSCADIERIIHPQPRLVEHRQAVGFAT